MRQFLKRLLVFLMIYFVVSMVFFIAFYDFINSHLYNYLGYESGIVNLQYKNLEKSNGINTLFLGTSKTFRQIDPLYFDSITNTKSLNLGINNLYPFRSIDFESFIKEDCKNVDNVIIEIRPLGSIGENSNTMQNLVAINSTRFAQMISYYRKSHGFSWKTKVLNNVSMLKFCAYKFIGLGSIRIIKDADNNYFPNSVIPSNGYFPLEQQMNDEIKEGNLSELYQEKNNFEEWINHNSLLDMFATDSFSDTLNAEAGRYLAKIYLEHLKSVFPNKNICFYVPPKTLKQYHSESLAQAAYYRGQGYQVVDFSKMSIYPDLYSREFSFDVSHLNNKGARKLTYYLAKQLKDSIHKESLY